MANMGGSGNPAGFHKTEKLYKIWASKLGPFFMQKKRQRHEIWHLYKNSTCVGPIARGVIIFYFRENIHEERVGHADTDTMSE